MRKNYKNSYYRFIIKNSPKVLYLSGLDGEGEFMYNESKPFYQDKKMGNLLKKVGLDVVLYEEFIELHNMVLVDENGSHKNVVDDVWIDLAYKMMEEYDKIYANTEEYEDEQTIYLEEDFGIDTTIQKNINKLPKNFFDIFFNTIEKIFGNYKEGFIEVNSTLYYPIKKKGKKFIIGNNFHVDTYFRGKIYEIIYPNAYFNLRVNTGQKYNKKPIYELWSFEFGLDDKDIDNLKLIINSVSASKIEELYNYDHKKDKRTISTDNVIFRDQKGVSICNWDIDR